MTTEEYLKKISRLKVEIRCREDNIQELETLATHITSTLDENKVGATQMATDKIGNIVAKIVDQKEELIKTYEVYLLLRSNIIRQIESIDDRKQYESLYLRYIKGLKIEDISEQMGYESRQILRILKAARMSFEQIYGKQYLTV